LVVILFLAFVSAITILTNRISKIKTIVNFESYWISAVTLATIGFIVASITTEHWYGFQSAFIYWWFAGLAVQRISHHSAGEY